MPVTERRPVAVPGNRWDQLDPPQLGEWQPKLRVSVILPYYENHQELQLTVAGLTVQSYPNSLIQVIVVDDGSPTMPAAVPSSLPFDVSILTQEDRGRGTGRARNFGARVAEGDLLLFLDSDIIPERAHVEAHARWHHVARRLVSLGVRRHADFSAMSPEEVARHARDGSIESLFNPDEVRSPEWLEAHLVRMDELRAPYEDYYLVMSGGNIGIDRDLYLEAGGTDESFTRWGGEDNELAYRLIQLGAVVVLERAATAWHQGEGHEPSDAELRALRLQKPKMRSLIPDRSTRTPQPGRSYVRPYLLIHVEPDGQPAEVVGLTVDSLLASDLSDIVVGIGKPEIEEDRTWLEANYEGEPRVRLDTTAESLFSSSPFSPARLTLPAGVAMNADTLDLALAQLGGPGVGLLHVTLPLGTPDIRLARLVMTRAENRARALGLNEAELDREIGRMFTEKWVSGTSLGVWPIEDPFADAGRVRARLRPSSAAGAEWRVQDLSAQLRAFQSRRSIRLIDGIGSFLRARSWAEAKIGLRSIVDAFTPRRASSGP